LAFAALALGAFLGGTWHSFFNNAFLWKSTALAVGVASFAMLAGSAFAVLSGKPRTLVLAFALAKLFVYSGLAFAAVALLRLWKLNRWILAGVAVSLAAALAQASGFAPHRRFNHNDLYHVIQIAAMALLYRGARRLEDASAA
jgi:hypothetical protein